MFDILKFWNRMIWNHLRHDSIRNLVYSSLKLYCEHLSQNVLEIPILLERLSVICTVRRHYGSLKSQQQLSAVKGTPVSMHKSL